MARPIESFVLLYKAGRPHPSGRHPNASRDLHGVYANYNCPFWPGHNRRGFYAAIDSAHRALSDYLRSGYTIVATAKNKIPLTWVIA